MKIPITDGPSLIAELRQHNRECAEIAPRCRQCALHHVVESARHTAGWCQLAQQAGATRRDLTAVLVELLAEGV